MYRSQFFEAIDLMTSELDRRFDQPTLHLLSHIENVLLTAVNRCVASVYNLQFRHLADALNPAIYSKQRRKKMHRNSNLNLNLIIK